MVWSPRENKEQYNDPVNLVEENPIVVKPFNAREKYLSDFAHICDQMLHTTIKKNNDYGGADDPFKNFREFEELGFLVRMSDKFARIKTALMEKRELQVKDETIEDTIIDLANYSILLLCYLRSKRS